MSELQKYKLAPWTQASCDGTSIGVVWRDGIDAYLAIDVDAVRSADAATIASLRERLARSEAALPSENMLRDLVDMVWNQATESEQVPSTHWADEIIGNWKKAHPALAAADGKQQDNRPKCKRCGSADCEEDKQYPQLPDLFEQRDGGVE